MTNLGRFAFLTAIAGALVHCNDGLGPGTQSYVAADSTNDVFGAEAYQPDVVTLTIRRDNGGIDIIVAFTAAVRSAQVAGDSGIVGFIDLDTDQDSTTGEISAVDLFRPGAGTTGLGVDYQVRLSYNTDSTVSIYYAVAGTEIGRVKPVFQGTRMSLRVPKALLGDDDGFLHAAAVVGTPVEPTDIVPNDRYLLVGPGTQPYPTGPRAAAARSPRGTW